MTRDQYRNIVNAQKKQRRPCTKIIHLLINFRSRCPERYPYGIVQVLKWAKDTTRNLNDALPEFYNVNGYDYSRPLFPHFKFKTRHVIKESKQIVLMPKSGNRQPVTILTINKNSS